MKFIAEIDEQELLLDVRREGARVVAEVEGRRYELEAREAEPGVLLLLSGGRVYECRVQEGGTGHASEVHVGRRTYSVTLSDPKRLRSVGAAHAGGGGRAEVLAPMPGKVVRVLVEQGQEVESGQGLVVVEAMKMQNELKSPKAGAVSELRAAAGATVNAGEVLAIIE